MNRGRTIGEAAHGSLQWRERHLQKSLDRIAATMAECYPSANLDRLQAVFDARRKLLRRLDYVQKQQRKQVAQNAMQEFQAPFKADHAEYIREIHEGQQ